VINADDFYGREAFRAMGAYLASPNLTEGGIIPYKLEKTLCPQGTVTRGVCVIEGDHLASVDELESIEKKQGGGIFNTNLDGTRRELAADTPVSMNFWGFPPSCLRHFRRYFRVKVLDAEAEWFGVTYQEDREEARRNVARLAGAGVYPTQLWNCGACPR
jgi:hypothetical protein